MDHDLTPDVHDTLRSLRGARGACPPAEALVEYEALAEEARRTHAIHEHVQVCSRCQLVLLNLDESAGSGSVASAPSRKPVLWGLAAAAVLAIAFGAPFITQRLVAPEPAPVVDTIRGTELQPIAPIGRVPAVEAFAWQSPITAVRYRVELYRNGRLSWTGETTTLTLAATGAPPFESGASYAWQVHAIDAEGVIRMSSPRQRFQLAK